MKKITAISVVSLLLLASCGGKGKDAASMDYGLEEANEVISYYNTSIDITKKMVDMGEISKIIDYMQKNGKTIAVVMSYERYQRMFEQGIDINEF